MGFFCWSWAVQNANLLLHTLRVEDSPHNLLAGHGDDPVAVFRAEPILFAVTAKDWRCMENSDQIAAADSWNLLGRRSRKRDWPHSFSGSSPQSNCHRATVDVAFSDEIIFQHPPVTAVVFSCCKSKVNNRFLERLCDCIHVQLYKPTVCAI